ncbi:MAG TPA: AAA family ATPase, partial [Anaerolinea sp.]|nr:AAA family ATPase [Anaerolinea sp.]
RLEHLYQLVAPDLTQEFPPLATGVAHPNNLPAQLTSFIGREKEIAGLQERIQERPAGLVTLTGSGGTGKTRLALRAAEQLLKRYPQGIWLVELAPVSDPELITRAVAESLGVREDAQRSLLQVLIDYMRDRHMLLILDNCEHVVGAAADLASALLHACPRLHILATSREILGVQGEVPFRCPSLGQTEAQRLFVERAQTISPGFSLTEANNEVIDRICRRLDGIPLAIELAAARTRMLSVDQIAGRLDQAFRLLTGGSRSVLPRHQTLKALIDWSYNLLSAEERVLLLRLSVFAGGWTLEAAEQVCSEGEETGRQLAAGLSPEQILDLLGQLIDKSLIQIEQDAAEEPRYRMLETVRQYARERLVESGGAEDQHERHLDYFLALAQQAEPNLRTRGARRWLDGLDREMDNLRQGLEWSIYGSVEKGLLLAAALLWFWHTRNHRAEGVEWLNRLLAAEEARSEERSREKAGWIARGRGLNVLSELSGRFVHAIRHGQVELGSESRDIFERLGDAFLRDRALSLFSMAGTREEYLACRQLFQEVGDLFYAAECTLELSSHALEINDLDQMAEYGREDLALRETLGDVDGEGFALFILAMWEAYCGDPNKAIEYSRKSMACFETVGNREMLSFPLSILSLVALAQGDYEQALEHIEEERALGQELASPTILIETFALEGLVAWTRKAYDHAAQCAQQSLEKAREMNIVWRKPANYVLGRVALSRGDYPLAQAHLLELLPKTRASAISPNDVRPLHLMGVLAARQAK